MADEVRGEHHVRLLDHLVAVELERVVVEQQRIAVLGRVVEVPALALEEALVLEDDAELVVARHIHVRCGPAPIVDLCALEPGLPHERGVGVRIGPDQPLDHACGHLEVLLRHQVRVRVVVHDRRVLVRSGHAHDREAPVAALVEVAELHPETRRLNEHGGALVEHEAEVAGHAVVLVHRVRDVGIDVVLRGAGRVPGGRLLAADRAPRVEGAAMAHLAGALARGLEHPAAELEHLLGPARVRVGEERDHIDLGVPK